MDDVDLQCIHSQLLMGFGWWWRISCNIASQLLLPLLALWDHIIMCGSQAAQVSQAAWCCCRVLLQQSENQFRKNIAPVGIVDWEVLLLRCLRCWWWLIRSVMDVCSVGTVAQSRTAGVTTVFGLHQHQHRQHIVLPTPHCSRPHWHGNNSITLARLMQPGEVYYFCDNSSIHCVSTVQCVSRGSTVGTAACVGQVSS